MRELLGCSGGEQTRPPGTPRVVRSAVGGRELAAGRGHLAPGLVPKRVPACHEGCPAGLGAGEPGAGTGMSSLAAEKGPFGPHCGGFLAEDQEYFWELRSCLSVWMGRGQASGRTPMVCSSRALLWFPRAGHGSGADEGRSPRARLLGYKCGWLILGRLTLTSCCTPAGRVPGQRQNEWAWAGPRDSQLRPGAGRLDVPVRTERGRRRNEGTQPRCLSVRGPSQGIWLDNPRGQPARLFWSALSDPWPRLCTQRHCTGQQRQQLRSCGHVGWLHQLVLGARPEHSRIPCCVPKTVQSLW